MQLLIQILNNKDMHQEVSLCSLKLQIKTKIVYLIQKWGLRFEKQSDILPLFYNVYKALLANGVKFPDPPAKTEVKSGSSGGTEAVPKKKQEDRK